MEKMQHGIKPLTTENLMTILSLLKWHDKQLDAGFFSLIEWATDSEHPWKEVLGIAEFESAERISNCLKDAESALQTLLDATQKEINVLAHQRAVMPKILAEGIRKLPNEIIARIFRIAFHEGFEDPVSISGCLSHVCRRFRDVSLGCSELWSTLDSMQPRECLEEYLVRSRSSPLDIGLNLLNGHDVDHRFFGFLEAAVAHTDRWRTLRFNSFSPEEPMKFWERLLGSCDALHLPKLEELELFHNRRVVADHGKVHFYTSWTFPRLRRLIVSNFVPLPIFGDTVTYCKLFLNGHNAMESVEPVLLFLRSLRKLKHLELRVSAGSLAFRTSGWNSTPITLPALETLEYVDAIVGDNTLQYLLLAYLHVPKIRNLKLRVESYLDDRSVVDPESFFPGFNDYRLLTHVNAAFVLRGLRLLPYREHSRTPSFTILGLILKRLPAVQHLAVKAHGIDPKVLFHVSDITAAFPPLCTLRLEQCDIFSDHVIQLVTAARRISGVAGFNKLEVISCPKMNWREIAKHVPAAQLVWRE